MQARILSSHSWVQIQGWALHTKCRRPHIIKKVQKNMCRSQEQVSFNVSLTVSLTASLIASLTASLKVSRTVSLMVSTWTEMLSWHQLGTILSCFLCRSQRSSSTRWATSATPKTTAKPQPIRLVFHRNSHGTCDMNRDSRVWAAASLRILHQMRSQAPVPTPPKLLMVFSRVAIAPGETKRCLESCGQGGGGREGVWMCVCGCVGPKTVQPMLRYDISQPVC